MTFLRKVALLCTACLMVSCIDMDYDLSKLDTGITLFEDGVAIPLGTTIKIQPASFLNADQAEGLVEGSDGSYALRFTREAMIKGKYGSIRDVAPISIPVDMAWLRNTLKENFSYVPDLVDPALEISISANFIIPGIAEFTAVPYTDGKAGESVVCKVDIPHSNSPSLTITRRMYLCSSDKNMPEGCEFAKCDIGGLLQNFPDSLVFTFIASIDSQQSTAAVADSNYSAGISCSLYAPLRFGSGFSCSVRDTIDARGLTQYISDNCVRISGEVASTLPVRAEMQLILLDENYHEIELRKPVIQMIEAGGADGSEVRTKIDMVLDPAERDAAADIQWLVTSVRALPSESDRILNARDYLQARLYLALPNGYTTDIGKNK